MTKINQIDIRILDFVNYFINIEKENFAEGRESILLKQFFQTR